MVAPGDIFDFWGTTTLHLRRSYQFLILLPEGLPDHVPRLGRRPGDTPWRLPDLAQLPIDIDMRLPALVASEDRLDSGGGIDKGLRFLAVAELIHGERGDNGLRGGHQTGIVEGVGALVSFEGCQHV